MHFLNHITVLLFASLAVLVHSDCGCGGNKLKRNIAKQPPDDVLARREALAASADNPPTIVDSVCHIDDNGQRICNDNDGGSGSTLGRLIHDTLSVTANMSRIAGNQQQRIGTDRPVFREDNESPVRIVNVSAFYLDRYAVSVADFGEFVEASGHETDAEHFGDSFLFKGEMSEAQRAEHDAFRVVNAVWWYKVRGVSWRHPAGVGSSVAG